MNQSLQDTIEREVVINAPKERVFQAISDPTKIVNWFPDRVEGSLSPGEQSIFGFGEGGKVFVYVEASDEPTYFSYRWLPGADYEKGYTGDVRQKPHTLVEFRLEEVAGGTRVHLKESGFASLPSEFYEACLKDNNSGWDYMLDRLVKLFSEE